jgi:uncharacterized protein YecE (DUF72 family)
VGLPHRAELAYAAERLGSIEINGTFYSLQRPASFQRWAEATPDDFVFALKGGRFITHLKRLTDIEAPLANFFASGVLALASKLGPILWQLPPNLEFDPDRLARFFERLPRDHRAAAELGARHDDRLDDDRVLLTSPVPDRPIRHALEVRHDSFRTPRLAELAAEHGIAVVTADSAGRWPVITTLTTDFGYVRLHGAEELYASGYDDDALDHWTETLAGWAERVTDCYVYFDNDIKVRAPFDAMSLIDRLRRADLPCG